MVTNILSWKQKDVSYKINRCKKCITTMKNNIIEKVLEV